MTKRVLPWDNVPADEMKNLNTRVYLKTHSKLAVILSHHPGMKIWEFVAPALDKICDEELKKLGY
jgi:hypothetical protein